MPKWEGSEILHCQLCKHTLGLVMIDGYVRTVAGNGWANVCETCHTLYGTGLGMGRGQKFQWDGKTWIKVEG